ncbi:MAG: hypothetical protein ACWA44_00625 [Thiotrichales bacterium]
MEIIVFLLIIIYNLTPRRKDPTMTPARQEMTFSLLIRIENHDAHECHPGDDFDLISGGLER